MTLDEIRNGDEAALREGIRARTGSGPVGRRTLEGLRVLAARTYGVPVEQLMQAGDASSQPAAEIEAGEPTPPHPNLAAVLETSAVDPAATDDTRGADLPAPAPGTMRCCVIRDYWPADGSGRALPGTVLDLPEAEAKARIRDGVLEWL